MKGVIAQQKCVAARQPAVGGTRVPATRCAVVADGLGVVDVGDTGGGGIVGGVGQPVESIELIGPDLAGPVGGKTVQGRGRAIGRERLGTPGVPHVPRDHGADRPDSMIGAGSMHRITATGADTEHADAFGIHVGDHLQRVDGIGDVLTSTVRVFQIPWLATAFSLVGGIEDERGDSACGKPGCVVRSDLLLDAAARSRQHDSRERGSAGDVVGEVKHGREVERSAGDPHGLGCHCWLPFGSIRVVQPRVR